MNRQTITQFPFKVFKLKVTNAGVNYTNLLINAVGKRLQVYKSQVTSKDPASGWPSIRFNETNADAFPLVEGQIYTLPFNRIFLSGAELVGAGLGDDITFLIFDNENALFENPELHPQRFAAFSASTNTPILGNVEKIFIKTFGNLQFYDYKGNTITLTGVLPGTEYFISPAYILGAGTTCTGVIYYEK